MTTKSFAVIRFCRSAHSEFGAYGLRSTMHKFRSLTPVCPQHSAARSNIPKANHASATLRGGAVCEPGMISVLTRIELLRTARQARAIQLTGRRRARKPPVQLRLEFFSIFVVRVALDWLS